MSLLNTHRFTVSRPLQGQWVNGQWVESPAQKLALRGSVQPAGASDLKLLPEGRRTERSYTLYSSSRMIEGDKTTLFGEEYEILAVEVWQNGLIPHYKAVATKQQKEGSL